MISKLRTQTRLACKNYIQNLQTEHSSNDHIATLCLQKRHREALEAFDNVANDTDFKIRPSTYARLICACSSLRSLRRGKKVHAHLTAAARKSTDVVLSNHVINMYGKCGSPSDALKVFDEMPLRNLVSWTSVISGLSQNGDDRLAVELYFRMRRSGFSPDEFTFGSAIKACSAIGDPWLGRQIHCHVVQSEPGDRVVVAQNALVSMYSKLGRIDDAFNVFSGIGSKDLVSWSSMISGFARLGFGVEALRHFEEMMSRGEFRPNEFVFGSALGACTVLAEPGIGAQIHATCVKYGLDIDVFAGCSLTDMYAKCGLLGSARSAFLGIDGPDLVSWNSIVSGFANGGRPEEVVSLFDKMRRSSGLRPNDVTFLSLLSACETPLEIGLGRQIHSCVVKTGFDSEIPVCNALLTMYAKCSTLSEAFKVFESMRSGNADSVSWNVILTASARHGEPEETLRVFKLMLSSRIRPDHVTLNNLISACSAIVSLEMGDQVHSFSAKVGLSTNVSVTNGLIDMYAKCGALASARRLFDFMECPDVVSWTSLIVGYAQFGDREEALKLFANMKSLCVKPNEVTLVGVLTACSHVGLVEEGRRIFETMESEHGINPTKEHCSCLVDLLGRSGRLKEAEEFIKAMPFEPDVVIWKTLLAASRTVGDVEIGKRAAENVVKLDPSNSAAIVLLSGIYASSGDWDDVARLRSLMRERGVRKVPGQSWIEIKGRTHAFVAEDTWHPERDRVYETLEELWSIMADEESDPLIEPEVRVSEENSFQIAI